MTKEPMSNSHSVIQQVIGHFDVGNSLPLTLCVLGVSLVHCVFSDLCIMSLLLTHSLAALLLVGPAVLVDPRGELQAALVDLRTNVAPLEQASTRYLSLYAIDAQRWIETYDTLSFVLNSVSQSGTLIRPELVPGTDGRLVRVSLARYGLPAAAWEKLASFDPYWHIRTQVVDPTTVSAKAKVREVFTDGGWVGLDEAAELRNLTASGGAVLRADFFLFKATTTLDGGAYYDLAGIAESELDFLRSIGIDVDTIDRLRADEGANLIHSQVTYKVRRVLRRQGPLGGVWQTYDVKSSTAERDPFRNPFAFTFDAGEYITAKKNGLHLYALYDKDGVRQDSVPDVIAKDTSDRRGAGIVVPMISCVRCHIEDGLRPFANDQRRLLAGRVDLFVDKPENAERLASFYETNIDKRLGRDRDDYAEAVQACTNGRTSVEIAGLLADAVSAYADQPVTAVQAARELGLLPQQLRVVLSRSHDPVLLALVEGLTVQRQQWEASFAEAAMLTAAIRSALPEKE